MVQDHSPSPKVERALSADAGSCTAESRSGRLHSSHLNLDAHKRLQQTQVGVNMVTTEIGLWNTPVKLPHDLLIPTMIQSAGLVGAVQCRQLTTGH